jgi:carbonic anhydrase
MSPFRTYVVTSRLSATVFALSLLACSKPAPVAEEPSSVASAAPAPEPAPSAPEPAAATEKPSARPAEWGYTGELDPSHWAKLSPAYEACAAGVMQSPVDIPAKSAKSGDAFRFSYGSARVTVAHHEHVDDIVDNGHTIQVTVEEGSALTTAKDTYSLKQFHFHTPSENKVDGKSFPMEAHFVHQSAQGAFAVVAVFFKEGAKNDSLQKLIDHFPANKGEKTAVEGAIDLSLHVPPKADTFHFLGSFTTPPCTENVEWIVYKDPKTASKEQLAAFATKLTNNNRPTQDFRSRPLSVSQLQRGASE